MQLMTDSHRADIADREVAGWQRAAQRALHPAEDVSNRLSVSDDVLAAIAAGLAAVTVPWELGHSEVPSERRYERVLSTAAYEAWVIYWPSGGSLDLHDHGGSAGAFSVVSGQLDEATIELGDEGGARHCRGRDGRRCRGPGSCHRKPGVRRGHERARVLPAAEHDGLLRARRRRCARRNRPRRRQLEQGVVGDGLALLTVAVSPICARASSVSGSRTIW